LSVIKEPSSRSARDKVRAERQRAEAQTRQKRQVLVLGLVVLVLVLTVAGGLVFQSMRARDRVPLLEPKGIPAGALSIPVGNASAPATLTVYEDFRCPACRLYEMGYGPVIQDLVQQGKLKIEYRVVTLIDYSALRGQGSRHSANAAACAQDQGKFLSYHDVLYRYQPAETHDEYADNTRLLELAGLVPGLKNSAFEQCVKESRHETWVKRGMESFQRDFAALLGTPTILLNGKNLNFGLPGSTAFTSPEAFRAAVDAAIRSPKS
jgi:protein-disulfide isomerase